MTTAGLNKSNPTIANTISARAIQDLPLPGGRNINNLILTVPNAQSTTGQGTYAINGNRPRNNNYMVDGSDNNDISVTIATSQIVPEAVAEFQVMQNPYSVEFGRNSGGQINVITKSGSNRFSGDAFDYYQTAGLNTLTNREKDNKLTDPAKRIRHQAGGDLGGPVVKDRLFFFGLFQRDSIQPGSHPGGNITIPTPNGYAALAGVPLGSAQSAASRQAVLQQISFLPDEYANNLVFRNVTNQLVNGVPIEIGDANVPIIDPSLYKTYLGRADYHPRTNDNFTFRYSLNDRADDGVGGTNFGTRFMASQKLIDTNFAASNAHVFSPTMLNEFRFSLVRRDLDFPEADPNSPTATLTGLFQIGGDSNFPQGRVSNAYQFSDTLTWNRSKHSMKMGADIRYNDVNNRAAFNSKGTFTFNNLQDYMNNSAFRVQQALQTADFIAHQWQSFLFAQDEYRMNSALTLDFGLRYEISGVPFGMFGATDPESLAAMVPGPVKKDTNNWAPRAGFAYSPHTTNKFIGDGKTVVRGGYGVAYDVLFYNLLAVNASNYPRVVTLDVNNVQDLYPNKLTGSASATFNPLSAWTNSAENTENPESRFYSLTVQREVRNYLFEVGYSGSRGAKGINQILINPAILTPEQAATVRAGGSIPSAQARRLHPEFGVRTLIPAYDGPAGNDVEAKSKYNAIFVSANRRLSRGLLVHTAYTYSKWTSNNDASLGEGGTAQSSQRPQDMFDYGAEWSRSNFDRPHRLAISYIWEIPGPKTGAARPDRWRLAAVRRDLGAVGADVHDLYGRRLERRHEHRFGQAEYQLVRLVRVGRSAPWLHEQRVLHGSARIQQPAADQQPRRWQCAAEQRTRRVRLEYRPGAHEAVRSAGLCEVHGARRRVQRAQPGQLRRAEQHHVEHKLRKEHERLGTPDPSARRQVHVLRRKPDTSCQRRGRAAAVPVESGTSIRITPSWLEVSSSPSRVRLMCRSTRGRLGPIVRSTCARPA